MKSTTIKIIGVTPLIMHSGRLADPLDPATLALAELTSKRKKTLDDHRAVSKAEWTGSIYVNEKGRPCLPGEVLEATLAEGAKADKLGKAAKAGIVVPENAELIYSGPKTVDGLWEHGGFLKRAGVKVGMARVIRSRPIFPEWSCKFEVLWDPSVIKSEKQLLNIAHAAGRSGVGDWRPKYGRFVVEE
jgi:hypothetical protein